MESGFGTYSRGPKWGDGVSGRNGGGSPCTCVMCTDVHVWYVHVTVCVDVSNMCADPADNTPDGTWGCHNLYYVCATCITSVT